MSDHDQTVLERQSDKVLTNELLIHPLRCSKKQGSKIPGEIGEKYAWKMRHSISCIRPRDVPSAFFENESKRILSASFSLAFHGGSPFYFIVSTFFRFFSPSLNTPRHLSQSDYVRAFPISLASVETNKRRPVSEAAIETFPVVVVVVHPHGSRCPPREEKFAKGDVIEFRSVDGHLL